MKYLLRLIRGLIVAFLLLLTVCTAAYRLDPAVSPELEAASAQSLGDRIAGVLNDAVTGIQNTVTEAGAKLAGSAMDTAANVERTGTYSDTGSEILTVDVPAGALSTASSAVSEELGGMVTTEDLVAGLNTIDGVSASQNEDGSVRLTVPEDVYEQYKEQIAGYLGN